MPFFKGMSKYAVRLFNIGTGHTEDRELFERDVRVKAKLFNSYSQSRSVSPRKRNQDQSNGDGLDGSWLGTEHDQHDDQDDHSSAESYDEPHRGQRRKRS